MNKREAYRWAAKRVRAQVERCDDLIAVLANTTAILKEYRSNFFWVGFYFVRPDYLLLGPFQGPPACVKLSYDRGVCAACAKSGKPIIVPDVHTFPGHVACDSRSNSEIVVPVFDQTGALRAVLDVDSQAFDDFDEQDEKGLTAVAALLEKIW
ncbi:MAG: GAF domain-containing protein [candidate division KSB1 bacterium]|nr:GAF domain-containing protein [candidate division KSB1 bacterium]